MRGSLWEFLMICGLFSAVAGNGLSTQYRGKAQHPELPDHCIYEELDLAVPLYGSALPTGYRGYCVKAMCTEDYLLMIRHCDPLPFPRNGCRLSAGNFELQHPHCCPQMECPNGVSD
ncbi:uncharacterized protein LOC116655344 [Drosophila ananassae]|nr:uncharacterized protein LOC116655344 [Drosophila ananassae]